MILTVFLWLFFSCCVAEYAWRKGRSGFWFFVIPLLTSPLIGFICALLAEPDQKRLDERLIKQRKAKRCPHCAELINVDAAVCKHCKSELVSHA